MSQSSSPTTPPSFVRPSEPRASHPPQEGCLGKISRCAIPAIVILGALLVIGGTAGIVVTGLHAGGMLPFLANPNWMPTFCAVISPVAIGTGVLAIGVMACILCRSSSSTRSESDAAIVASEYVSEEETNPRPSQNSLTGRRSSSPPNQTSRLTPPPLGNSGHQASNPATSIPPPAPPPLLPSISSTHSQSQQAARNSHTSTLPLDNLSQPHRHEEPETSFVVASLPCPSSSASTSPLSSALMQPLQPAVPVAGPTIVSPDTAPSAQLPPPPLFLHPLSSTHSSTQFEQGFPNTTPPDALPLPITQAPFQDRFPHSYDTDQPHLLSNSQVQMQINSCIDLPNQDLRIAFPIPYQPSPTLAQSMRKRLPFSSPPSATKLAELKKTSMDFWRSTMGIPLDSQAQTSMGLVHTLLEWCSGYQTLMHQCIEASMVHANSAEGPALRQVVADVSGKHGSIIVKFFTDHVFQDPPPPQHVHGTRYHTSLRTLTPQELTEILTNMSGTQLSSLLPLHDLVTATQNNSMTRKNECITVINFLMQVAADSKNPLIIDKFSKAMSTCALEMLYLDFSLPTIDALVAPIFNTTHESSFPLYFKTLYWALGYLVHHQPSGVRLREDEAPLIAIRASPILNKILSAPKPEHDNPPSTISSDVNSSHKTIIAHHVNGGYLLKDFGYDIIKNSLGGYSFVDSISLILQQVAQDNTLLTPPPPSFLFASPFATPDPSLPSADPNIVGLALSGQLFP